MNSPRLGLLGGGQLARMLALSAHPLGYPVAVLTAHASDPAAQVVAKATLGSLDDEKDLSWFLKEIDVVTFESEFVDTEKLARAIPKNVEVFPALDVIATIQDRLPQKRLLDRMKIPTAPWISVDTEGDLSEAEKKFSQGFVLKQRRFGYDGYGTFVCKKGKAEPDILNKSKFGFIAESFVAFKRELAISFVRSKSGAFLALPLVESVQKDSRCFSVVGPIEHKETAKLTAKFKKLMESLGYVGILAVELFDTGKELLVNELAPRVHNSAHYSQNALTCSQFEYHWRAGLDLPLPKVQILSKAFAMVNLLGEGHPQVQLARSSFGALHWYGKPENRKGRKLGHINVLGTTRPAALQTALKWRKEFTL